MFGILHIGNPCFDEATNVDAYCDSLQRSLQKFGEAANDLRLIVVSGNLTTRGDTVQFDRLLIAIERLSKTLFRSSPEPGEVRTIAVPGPKDVRIAGGQVDSAAFRTFLTRLVPEAAILGYANLGGPFAIKLKGLSVVGLLPSPQLIVDKVPSREWAAQQLDSAIELVRGFHYRLDSVPKIIVSASAELAFSCDASGSSSFEAVCTRLRNEPLFDLHLFSEGLFDSLGARPFGLPLPSVGIAPFNGKDSIATRGRMNLLLFKQEAGAEIDANTVTQIRKTLLMAADPQATTQVGQPAGRLGQPFQYLEFKQSEPSLAVFLDPIVQKIARAIFDDGSNVVVVKGLPGSGKRILFDKLKQSDWLPPGFRASPLDLRRPFVSPGGREKSVAIIMDIERSRQLIDDSLKYDESTQRWLERVSAQNEAVVYILSDNDNPPALPAVLRPAEIKLPTEDKDRLRKLLGEIGRRLPIESGKLAEASSTYVGFVSSVVEDVRSLYETRSLTSPISSETSRELLLASAYSRQVWADANQFIQRLRELSTPYGAFFVEAVLAQRARAPGDLSISVPVSDVVDLARKAGANVGGVGILMAELQKLRIVQQGEISDTVVVDAAFPFFVMRNYAPVSAQIVYGLGATPRAFETELRDQLRQRRLRLDPTTDSGDLAERSRHLVLLGDPKGNLRWMKDALSRWISLHAEALLLGKARVFVRDDFGEDELRKFLDQAMPCGLVDLIPNPVGPAVGSAARLIAEAVFAAESEVSQ
jgi:hypothetical protein